MAVSLSTHSSFCTGRCCESYGMRVIFVSIAAIFALSNSGTRVFFTGSTSIQRVPWGVSKLYQNRSLSSAQCGWTEVSKTSFWISSGAFR